MTIIGEGRAGKSSAVKSITRGAYFCLLQAQTLAVVTSIYSIEKFEDTESTCGVATCDVINVSSDGWNKNDTPEAVKLMRRQMVPRCRLCKTAPQAGGQGVCVSCAKVGF